MMPCTFLAVLVNGYVLLFNLQFGIYSDMERDMYVLTDFVV